MAYPNGSAPIIDSHEDRIQRLESGQQKLVSQSTEALIKIEGLDKRVAETHESLKSSIETGFEKLGSKLDGLYERVASLEKKNDQSTRNWDAVKKTALFVLIGAAGVVVTKFGESLWVWLTR